MLYKIKIIVRLNFSKYLILIFDFISVFYVVFQSESNSQVRSNASTFERGKKNNNVIILIYPALFE